MKYHSQSIVEESLFAVKTLDEDQQVALALFYDLPVLKGEETGEFSYQQLEHARDAALRALRDRSQLYQ